jgi:hypothetical protein
VVVAWECHHEEKGGIKKRIKIKQTNKQIPPIYNGDISIGQKW